MATAEAAQHAPAHERPGRKRPFSTWMKKLAHFKSSTNETSPSSTSKRNVYQMKSQSKKNGNKNNNPYLSTVQGHGSSTAPVNRHLSFSTGPTGRRVSTSSLERSRRSFQSSLDGGPPPTIGNRSLAYAASTEQDTATSDLAQSHGASSGAGTTGTTVGGGLSTRRGADSTFSSPAPSLRSLATTLTTIQSAAASTAANGTTTNGTHGGSHGVQSGTPHSVQFTHQFPTSNPATALPAHLAPHGSGGHPATYSTATANSLLTDNASILTLASSSRRRRRRSMDTDASVRALAPSSVFGGSRESLPLSVLSMNLEHNTTSSSGIHQPRPNVGGSAAERASVYSATGVVPALPNDRNSYYAGKQGALSDGGSMKSGFFGHGRAESLSGSIAGNPTMGSPLAAPREATTTGRLSRKSSTLSPVDDSRNENEKDEDNP